MVFRLTRTRPTANWGTFGQPHRRRSTRATQPSTDKLAVSEHRIVPFTKCPFSGLNGFCLAYRNLRPTVLSYSLFPSSLVTLEPTWSLDHPVHSFPRRLPHHVIFISLVDDDDEHRQMDLLGCHRQSSLRVLGQ